MEYMKKLLVVGVIGLFLGLACAPSINANITKNRELVEVTTEIYGLNGGKQTVKLTQQQAIEVEELFDSIREQLNATESREEAEEIFKDTVVELDTYGMLGELSVKQAQRLVMERYQDSKAFTISDVQRSRLQKNTSNFLCLIAGSTNSTNFDSQLELFCGRISVLVSSVGPILFDKFPLYTFFLLGYFLLNTYNFINPVALASRINLGGEKGGGWHPEFVEFYAHGWITTMSLLGTQRHNGKMLGAIPLLGTGTISEGYIYVFNPGVIGFTGLHIYNPLKSKHFYLGSALWVNLEEV
jgi:hypothetical protein